MYSICYITKCVMFHNITESGTLKISFLILKKYFVILKNSNITKYWFLSTLAYHTTKNILNDNTDYSYSFKIWQSCVN